MSTDQAARAETVLSQGIAELELEDEAAYLAVALVPQVEGFMSISRARIREIEKWGEDPAGTYFWRGFFGSRPRARPGLRRVLLAYGLENSERPTMPYAELYSDGAGFTCERLSRPVSAMAGPEKSSNVCIPQVSLLWETARSLGLLGRHAVENTGAWGEAVLIARLIGANIVLTYMLSGMIEQGVTERSFSGPIDSRHTLLLDSIAGADQELLASTRMVAGDLFNALGAAEMEQIDPEGRIRTRYLKTDARFMSFAESCGVELSDERVRTG